MNDYDASRGVDVKLKAAGIKADLDAAIKLNARNAYLYYNRGNLYAAGLEYDKAVADYTTAISIDHNFAEAYYNRGLSKIYLKDIDGGIRDLSKAGELGLFEAYSVIKKYSKK